MVGPLFSWLEEKGLLPFEGLPSAIGGRDGGRDRFTWRDQEVAGPGGEVGTALPGDQRGRALYSREFQRRLL